MLRLRTHPRRRPDEKGYSRAAIGSINDHGEINRG
jgi:hypothetical protein